MKNAHPIVPAIRHDEVREFASKNGLQLLKAYDLVIKNGLQGAQAALDTVFLPEDVRDCTLVNREARQSPLQTRA